MSLIAPPVAVHAAQRTFRALLDAMARPGEIGQLALAPDDMPELAVCTTLLDHEVTYATSIDDTGESERAEALERRIALEIGCPQSSLPDAAFTVSYGALPASAWPVLRRGTLAYPDQGATIIYVIAAIGSTARDREAISLALTGPGIETERYLTLSGLEASEFQYLSAANRDYPMGVDAIFLDPSGRVTCLPRSCNIVARSSGAEGT